jgi:hypothetical protein
VDRGHERFLFSYSHLMLLYFFFTNFFYGIVAIYLNYIINKKNCMLMTKLCLYGLIYKLATIWQKSSVYKILKHKGYIKFSNIKYAFKNEQPGKKPRNIAKYSVRESINNFVNVGGGLLPILFFTEY